MSLNSNIFKISHQASMNTFTIQKAKIWLHACSFLSLSYSYFLPLSTTATPVSIKREQLMLMLGETAISSKMEAPAAGIQRGLELCFFYIQDFWG